MPRIRRDKDHTHYVIRVGVHGNIHTVDYPVRDDPENPEASARRQFKIMMGMVLSDGTSGKLHIRLIYAKAGSRRASGAIRFYEKEIESFIF